MGGWLHGTFDLDSLTPKSGVSGTSNFRCELGKTLSWRTAQQSKVNTLGVTYERGGVVGTEAGVDGPSFPVLAQNLCVVGRVSFY